MSDVTQDVINYKIKYKKLDVSYSHYRIWLIKLIGPNNYIYTG